MTFLFDNDLSPTLPAALAALGERTYHVREVLGPRTPDEAWLAYAGERDWCVVTQDHRILKRPHERAALSNFGVGAFFLTTSVTGHCNIVQTLIRNWPEIKRQARSTPRPFILAIHQSTVRSLK